MLKRVLIRPWILLHNTRVSIRSMFKSNQSKHRITYRHRYAINAEKGIRGGLSQAIHRYATANNKYMSNYNSQQLSTFLMFLDANNLYGWAMCKKLPI